MRIMILLFQEAYQRDLLQGLGERRLPRSLVLNVTTENPNSQWAPIHRHGRLFLTKACTFHTGLTYFRGNLRLQQNKVAYKEERRQEQGVGKRETTLCSTHVESKAPFW